MSICFYTITPEPPRSPIAYICRVFLDTCGSADCIDTKSFPIRSPQGYRYARDEAEIYGKLTVASVMSEVQS